MKNFFENLFIAMCILIGLATAFALALLPIAINASSNWLYLSVPLVGVFLISGIVSIVECGKKEPDITLELLDELYEKTPEEIKVQSQYYLTGFSDGSAYKCNSEQLEKKGHEFLSKDFMSCECKKMDLEFIQKWTALSLYLENEFDLGKTEFIVHINSDKSFYIHPYGKDGITLDGNL